MKDHDISDRQLAANRANALKSTGPQTPEGKEASSHNAVTHGITAKSPVLSLEDRAEFELLRQDYHKEFNPITNVESDLVEELVKVRWHMRRMREIEDAHFELELARPDIRQGFDLLEGAVVIAVAHGRLHQSGVLDLVNRQLSRLSRECSRLMNMLLDLRDRRPPQAPLETQVPLETQAPLDTQTGQNEPIPIPEHARPSNAPLPLSEPLATKIRYSAAPAPLVLTAGTSTFPAPAPPTPFAGPPQ